MINQVKQLKFNVKDPVQLDRTLNTLQSNMVNTVNAIVGVPVIQGNLLEVQFEINKETLVNHGLGRVPRGFDNAFPSGAVKIWESSASNPQKDKYIILLASNNLTTSLWIY